MNDIPSATRPDQTPWTNVVFLPGDAFLGNTFRRAGMRPSDSIGKITHREDQVFDMAKAAEHSAEEISGKTAHQSRLRTDRNSYELKDDF